MLPKGAASTISTNLANYQVAIKCTWNDGSVKHAIISGRAALAASTPQTVTVSSGGTVPSGTNLTSASIVAAAPSASIQCGAFGTVVLASLLASPFRTWVSGPEMVECHYRADVGGGTLLSAWFYVRLFADGRKWVRAFVENGYFDNGAGALASNADRSYVPTIIVGGVTVYNNGGASLAHAANTRWTNPVEAWIGGDPAVTPLHNVAYLRTTKLVLNYGYLSPNGSAVSALVQTYTPMTNGPHETSMGSTGFAPGIGLLPNWDALYATTGDVRALRAVIAGSSSLNSYPIVWRDKTTNGIIKPSSWGAWTMLGNGGGGVTNLSSGGLTWESSHHPNEGYLAYLLTGDYWHLETLGLTAACCYLVMTSGNGSGTARLMKSQTRGMAWQLRSIGCYAAIAPDGDAVAADYAALLASNYTYLAGQAKADDSKAWSGALYVGEYNSAWGGSAGGVPPWQLNFAAATNGFLSEIEPLTSTADLIYARDWSYKWPVGLLGESGVISDFDFTRAGAYGVTCATSGTGATWQQRWGDIHAQTFGSNNTTATNTLQGTSGGDPASMATGYWGNMMPALCYAVDHKADGAITAWKRLTGATNFASGAATFNDTPVWGTVPLEVFAPAYTLPSSANTSTLIGTNTADAIKPAGYGSSTFSIAVFGVFGGGAFSPYYKKAGAYVHTCTGGHGGPNFQGAVIFDLETATWSRLDNANGVANSSSDYAPGDTNGSPYYEVNAASAGQFPACTHSYGALTGRLREGTRGSVMYVTRPFVISTPASSPTAHKQDLATGLWTRAATGSAAYTSAEASVSYDPNLHRWYVGYDDLTSKSVVAYLRGRDMTWQSLSTGSFSGGMSPAASMAVHPGRRCLVFIDGASSVFVCDLVAGGGIVSVTATGSFGSVNSNNLWTYNPRTDTFYQRPSDGSSNVINTLKPPNTASGGVTGTWTRGSITVGGSGLPARTEGNHHYSGLQYVPQIDRLIWVAGATQQVAVVKV